MGVKLVNDPEFAPSWKAWFRMAFPAFCLMGFGMGMVIGGIIGFITIWIKLY